MSDGLSCIGWFDPVENYYRLLRHHFLELFDAKRERYIDDVLTSPITPFQIALATSWAAPRGMLLVGAGMFALTISLAGLPAECPLLLLAAGVATSVAFASLGSRGRGVGNPYRPYLLFKHYRHPAPDLPGCGLLLGGECCPRLCD